MIPKIKKIKRTVSCCNKKKGVILNQLLTDVFFRLQIEKQVQNSFDFSIVLLEKHIAKQKLECDKDRIRVRSILKNLHNF